MTAHVRSMTSWWRSPESTRTFWRLLVTAAGLHAVLVAYVVLWVSWAGPASGLDRDSATLVPEPIQESLLGYALASLVLFLAAGFLSGHRSNRAPGKALFAVVATYFGFSLGYMWLNLRLPDGRNFIDTWLPLSQTFTTPVLWPMYAAAALMLWRVLRPVPHPLATAYSLPASRIQTARPLARTS